MQQCGQRFDGAGQGQADLDRPIGLGLGIIAFGGGNRHALGHLAACTGRGLAADLLDGVLHEIGSHGVGVVTGQQAVALRRVVARLPEARFQLRLLKHQAGVATLLFTQCLRLFVEVAQRGKQQAVDEQVPAGPEQQAEHAKRDDLAFPRVERAHGAPPA
ncbi:hypothetical protein D3C80_1519190 [compost metagenome]